MIKRLAATRKSRPFWHKSRRHRTLCYIGHRRTSQTVEYETENVTHFFTFDGHGSTRVLFDTTVAMVQLYAFDAYDNALGFNPSEALTEFLYSGEQFDSKIGQQYLRQRYYDATTGRFKRLDPFFGNLNDPQSLHKYAYVHNDPVNMTDPNGLFWGMVGLGISMSVGSNMRGMNAEAVGGTYNMFSNFIHPMLQIPGAVIQAYQEVMLALTQFRQGLIEHFSQASVSALGWQSRIKVRLSDNADIVLSHGLRPDYGYDTSNDPIHTWGMSGAVSVSFTLKMTWLLRSYPKNNFFSIHFVFSLL